jgi:molybdenum cofactor biosynthesis protein B
MAVEKHRAGAVAAPRWAVITVSDTRTEADDLAGAQLVDRARRAGHQVTRRVLVPDRVADIRDAVRRALGDAAVDAVLVTGGTGLAPRDLTPEAVLPLLEREIAGFGELFRQLSFAQVGAAAMLSRATAGVVRDKAIFLLPGSPRALGLAMERLILPEIGHLLAQIRRRG